MIGVKIISKPKSGGGGVVSGGVVRGTVDEAKHAATADKASFADKAANAEYAERAAYADLAYDLAEDSPAAKRFLSRIADDVAEGRITFNQGLTALGLAIFKTGAEFGEFIRSMYAGKGAGIDENGNAEFESVRVRSYFEAMEFIVNRLTAIEGDQLLTEGDTIESVDDLGDNWFRFAFAQQVGGVFHGASRKQCIERDSKHIGARQRNLLYELVARE